MAFDVNTITVQGAIAIASATAGNKLVIDGCDAVTSIYTQAQAVQIASRPATPDSTTTSIALAGSTENHVYSYASFIQGETGQPGGDVHSFLLYGHSENTPNVVVVVAVASSTDPVHLPEPGDVTNRTEVQFELTFSATDEVVTVAGTSMYTTRGEFLLLKNRTVTIHAEGETTVGDDQTIYGDKTFADGLAISTLSGISTSPITLASSVIPSGISAKLGAGDHMFSEVFAHYVTGAADSTRGTCYTYCGNDITGSTYRMNWYAQSEHKGLEAKIYLSTEDESGTATKEVAGIRLRDGSSTKAQMELSYNKAQDKAVITFTVDEITFNGDVSVAGDVGCAKLSASGDVSVAGDVGCAHLSASSDITTAQSYVCSGQGRLRARGTLDCVAKNGSGDTAATLHLDASTTDEPELFIDLTDENGDRMAGLWLTKDCELYLESDSGPTRLGKMSAPLDYVIAYNFTANNNMYLSTQNKNNTTTATINLYSQTTDSPVIEANLEDSATNLITQVQIFADMSESECYLSMYSDIYETCIGRPTVKIDHIYAKDLQGVIPNPSNNTSAPPVGTIFFACVDMNTTGTISAGATLNLNSSPISPSYLVGIRFATIRFKDMTDSTCSFSAEGSSFGEGIYRALSGAGRTGSSGNYAFCLLMRIG